jgi:exopolyphosphatase / guanosine-5'-triphosphate,3'-diphosphate pyrophosphatase
VTGVRVAAVDIGTNTVRLLVADVDGATLVEVERRSSVVGLGRGVDASRRLDPEAAERTLAALASFGAAIDRARVDRRRAVATSASRDATDAADFLDAASSLIGTRPETISGTEEAILSFRGAVWGLPGETPAMVIDPGGGSTEFAWGDAEPADSISVDIGSVRLTERHLPERPARAAAVAEARRRVRALFDGAPLPEVARVIGVGGTFTSLAAIHLGLERHRRDLVHGSRMGGDDLDGLVDRLSRLTVEETASIPSLEPGRAPVLLAGAIVAAEALRRSGRRAIRVAETDLLEGMALSLSDGA